MSTSYYPTTYNSQTGNLETETFNNNDFEANYGSVTLAQLQSYANLHYQNFFTNSNYFSSIFVTSINGVSDNVLTYLENITGDVQSAINTLNTNVTNLLTTTTNMTYDSTNNVTLFNDSVDANVLATPNNLIVAGNADISNSLNVTNINNQNMLSNSIFATAINTKQLICNGDFSSYSDVGCYLYILVLIPYTGQTTIPSLLTIPLKKSQLMSTLCTPTNPFICSVTLKEGYRIDIANSVGTILYSLTNNTQDFIYNRSISISDTPYRIILYKSQVLL